MTANQKIDKAVPDEAEDQIREILMNLNRGRIPVDEAKEQIMILFTKGNDSLLKEILEKCKTRYSEFHEGIVESYLTNNLK